MIELREIIKHRVYESKLSEIDMEPDDSILINTINAHSYCMTKNDKDFAQALKESNYLLPDGVSMVLASRILLNRKIKKIAGADLHEFILEEANLKNKKVFYLGSTNDTLLLIKKNLNNDFPNIVVDYFSPPFKSKFDEIDNAKILKEINRFKPDFLFVGMTAPKQEKWVYLHKDRLNSKVIVSIGAVFDFYAGNIKRAPKWMINLGFEWLYRLIKEPKRMWKRYLINNTVFLFYIIKEKIFILFKMS